MSIPTAKLLIVDDEAPLMRALCDTLESHGYEATGFTSATEALDALRERSFDLILTDLMMPLMDGISVLKAAFEIDPNLAGIMITGHGSVDTAVSALKAGAVDYILKPFKLSVILPVLTRALTMRRLRMENIQFREAVGLYELSMAIAFADNSTIVLDKIADAAIAQTNARGLAVLLVDEHRGQRGPAGTPDVVVAAVRGAGSAAELTQKRFPLTGEIKAWAERCVSVGLDPDGGAESSTESSLHAQAPLDAAFPPGLSIPMLAGGQLTGILHFDQPERMQTRTLGQSRAMRILAGTGASALVAISGSERLRAAEERYRRLAEQAADIVSRWELHPHPAITYVNPAILTATGYTPEDYYSDPELSLKIVHPEDREIVDRVNRGEYPSGSTVTVRWVGKSGKEIWVEQRNTLVRDYQGRLTAIESVSRDITERKTLEERLRHSERLEAIGKLTAGIAHDFNNLLTVINGFSSLAQESAEPSSQMWSRIGEVRNAGEQAAALTAQLLAFSRKQILRPRALNLEETLAGMEQMIQATAGPAVEVTLRTSPTDAWIKIDPVQIQQVIMNLTVNARDAMPGGGRLSFEMQSVEVGEQTAKSLGMNPGSYVTLIVRDTGCGMPPEVIQRVFEPFFTTKELGRGTGLGLATVHGIVEQSGGHIQIESQPQVGTTFSIWLPRCAADIDLARVESPEIARGHETILLVEDDAGVRRLATEILAGAGYHVLAAETGEAALRLAKTHCAQISLLISDMCLPGTNGSDLAGRIREICPKIKCLFVSGFTDVAPAPLAGDPSHREFEFLAKPYAPAELCKRVRTLLTAPAPADAFKKVLVVDDEASIRRLLQEILEGAGYEVMTAQNGREARKTLKAERSVDLVITDLVMPEMEGMEFISAMRKERPELKIVAITGGGNVDYLRAASLLGAHATLPKPVTAARLLDCLRNPVVN